MLPSHDPIFDISKESAPDSLRYLALLQKHHFVEILFENLTLHYSHHHQISLCSDELYKKIVESEWRGGYYMEKLYFWNFAQSTR